MKTMVLTDNEFLFTNFKRILEDGQYDDVKFNYFCSDNNCEFADRYKEHDLKPINVKRSIDEVVSQYQLVLSLHCKQLFPKRLVEQVRCINVHPGYNPFNRGWFPQVFSILNKLPVGVTIHEMDEQLDHGNIIARQEVDILPWETSYDVYQRIQCVEIEMLRKHLRSIIDGTYAPKEPDCEGNVNLKRDFDSLCKIDLEKQVSFGEVIDYFRAMTFKGYNNAYFYDEQGRKIFVELSLTLETEV